MISEESSGPASLWLRGVAILGIIVPLAVLAPGWWDRSTLDGFSMLSYLGCAVAPLPFGAWVAEAFGPLPKARIMMLAGLVLALVGGVAAYGALIAAGTPQGRPPEAMLVVPLGQLFLVLITAFAAWMFGRR